MLLARVAYFYVGATLEKAVRVGFLGVGLGVGIRARSSSVVGSLPESYSE